MSKRLIAAVLLLLAVPASRATAQEVVDLAPDLPGPGDQGKPLSCVAWTVATVKALRSGRFFSPAYIYNQLNDGRNIGISFRAALDLAREQGVAPWEEMPYRPGDLASQPTEQARAAARNHRIASWRDVRHTVAAVRTELAEGRPVLLGARTDAGFRDVRGVPGYTWKDAGGPADGQHAMVICGYDDRLESFRILNSWGTRWGDGGYARLTYAHFTRVVMELYVAVEEPLRPARIARVAADAKFKAGPDLRPYVRLDGTFDVRQRGARIVVRFYVQLKDGRCVPVLSGDRTWAGRDGEAVAEAGVVDASTGTWGAWIPREALVIPRDAWHAAGNGWRVTLIAVPVVGTHRGEPMRLEARAPQADQRDQSK